MKSSDDQMEFGVQLQRGKSLNPKKDKKTWSVEDCVSYMEKNIKLPASKRGLPLHKLLQGSRIVVNEVKEVGLRSDDQP